MKKAVAVLLLGSVAFLLGGGEPLAQNNAKQAPRAIPLKLDGGKAAASDTLTKDDPTDTARAGRHRKTYSIQFDKGRHYRIDLTSKAFDAWLRLEDAAGKALASDDDGGGQLNARIRYTCPATGTYHLVATTYAAGKTGAYALAVEDLGTGGTIALEVKAGKAQASAALTTDDSKDVVRKQYAKVYLARFEAGTQYVIDMQSSAFDAFLRLEDAASKQLAEDDDSGGNRNARIRFSCATAGTYRIITTSCSGGVGAFALAVRQIGMNKIALALQDGRAQVQGVLTRDDVRDHASPGNLCKLYEARLEAGQRYRIDMISTAFDAYLRLEDAAGKQLARDDDGGEGRNARITFTCPATGNYLVVATTTGSVGAFTLAVESLAPPGPRMLSFQARDEGTLTADDPRDKGGKGYPHRAYSVRFEADRLYRIDMTSKAIDSFLRLEGPDGKEVAQNDDGGGGLDARIVFLCRTPGTYRVIASARARSGPYTLVVGQQEVPRPTVLALKGGSGRVEARLTNEDATDPRSPAVHCKVYAVQLEAGQVYRVEQTSKDFTTAVRLEDPAGKDVVRQDRSAGENNRLTFLCRRSGTYHIVASRIRGPASGSFTLTVERQNAQRAADLGIKGGSTTDGQLTKDALRDPSGPARPVRVYLVRLEAGKTYRFDLASRQFDSYLRLENEDGAVVAEDDDNGGGQDARLIYRCTQAGTYFLLATTYATPVKYGAFTLAAQAK